jgi:hypothetical protein
MSPGLMRFVVITSKPCRRPMIRRVHRLLQIGLVGNTPLQVVTSYRDAPVVHRLLQIGLVKSKKKAKKGWGSLIPHPFLFPPLARFSTPANADHVLSLPWS